MSIDGRFINVIDGLLTPNECADFIKLLNNDELEDVKRGDMASYQRNIWTNDTFAQKIYSQVISRLPPGTTRCNEVFRFSKYHPGQEFKIHTDGTNQDKFGNRSKYTINIFLNTEFRGGETDFFYESGKLAIRAKPQIGRAVIFDREIHHCGNKVFSGNKYLLRTDVMVPIPELQTNSEDVKVIRLSS
jgi:hypothetical protein